MEDNFNNRDFEQFVKQNADQYRMFPSVKVWKNIHHALHTRRRWYGLGLIVLLLTAGIVTWVMLTPSVRNNESLSFTPAVVSESKPIEKENSKTPVLIAADQPENKPTHFITTADNLNKNLFISGDENIVSVTENDDKFTVTPVSPSLNESAAISPSVPQVELPTRPVLVYNKQTKTEKPANNKIVNKVKDNSSLISESNNTETPVTDKHLSGEKKDVFPLTIESVVNSYKHKRSGKKLSWEVFVTPTVSYRRLSENKAFVNSAQASNNIYNYSNSVADINSIVTHRPDMGLQLGFNAGYPLSKNLKVVGGLQFNVSKYDIRVTYSTGDVATIALNTGGGANSVSTISNYRNISSGSKADWLRNYYFSVSVPLGVELKLAGNNKYQLGVIGTVQPTYLLSDRAYLLSTDYKNYAEVPSLTRKFNINTSFEIFAGFSTGNINWRVGPLVRYQLKSSYVAKYPFKEHLFDFGLKLGVMLKK